MNGKAGIGAAALLAAALAALPGAAASQERDEAQPKTVIGPRNPDLQEGARKLLDGDAGMGIELTLRGLAVAQGAREEEAALSNLCAGYIMLEQYDKALEYCNMVLERNDRNWRGYNNRALVYIHTKQYDKAHADLEKGEALNPDARTLQIARAMYLDAVQPVTPEVEIDDRPDGSPAEPAQDVEND
ncbi:MAG TPA: tetratricopeptide repeat protein [Woeseiaceae bacterium]|nr:tetratricopeptide repeat protein [Woeseiaceae bacterium]